MSNTTRQDYAADRVEHEATHIDPAAVEAANDVGLRVQTFIAPKDLLPGRDPAWAIQKIAPLPQGTLVPLGSIAGVAIGAERKTFTDPKGATTESIWLRGDFTATAVNPETGEVSALNSGNLILPRAMGEKVENSFKAGAERADLDLEVAVEATGRMIPYAYVVTTYGDDPARRVVNAILERQQKRSLARQAAQKLLTA